MTVQHDVGEDVIGRMKENSTSKTQLDEDIAIFCCETTQFFKN